MRLPPELIGWWRWLALVLQSDPRLMAAQALVTALTGLVPAVIFATTGRIVSALTHRTPVLPLVILLALLFVVGDLLGVVMSFLSWRVNGRQTIELHRRVMHAVGRLPGLGYFEDERLANHLSEALRGVQEAHGLFRMLARIAAPIASAAAVSTVVGQVAWWAPILVLASAVPGGWNACRLAGKSYAAFKESLPTLRHASYPRSLALSAQAGKEARLFGLGAWMLDRQSRFWWEGMRQVWATARRQMWGLLAVQAVRIPVALVPFVAAVMAVHDGRLTAGQFTAVALGLISLVDSATYLEYDAGVIRESGMFLPALFQLLDLADRQPDLIEGRRVALAPAMRHGIQFTQVSFRYPGAETPVLEHLDLYVPAGGSLALVGANGAGKSTIVKLLCRFYDPDSGSISVDGVDLRELDVVEWRRRLAVIFQDFVRFPFRLSDNVGLGCDERGDREAVVEEALQLAGAAEIARSLPQDVDTVLSPTFGGVGLSDGQWQRVALARCMASVLGRGASVLVLDEPSASLDVRVEHELYRRFAEITSGRTTLLISHRLSTVRMAQEIAVLRDGRVVERGSHAELIANGGEYAALYELQARQFRETGVVE